VLAGLVLLLNLFGAADLVIRRVTSRSLGELAPGFAATPRGFKVYAALVVSLGIVCAAFGVAGWSASFAAWQLIAGSLLFAVASVTAIAGEVATYRRLKR